MLSIAESDDFQLHAEVRLSVIRALDEKLKDACDHKKDAEERMLENERQYHGIRDEYQENDVDDTNKPERALGNNVTRQKVNIAASRIGDMLFPTNDSNYELTIGNTSEDLMGNPIDHDQAQAAKKFYEDEIQDILQGSKYSKTGRAMIFDGVKLGTGVLKGPVMKRRRVRRVYSEVPTDPETGEPLMVLDEFGNATPMPAEVRLRTVIEEKAAVEYVDPFQFFPLPARNMDECPGVFELHLMQKKELMELGDFDGFDSQAVAEVARLGPNAGDDRANHILRRRRRCWTASVHLGEYFSVWEYHGPLSRRDLAYLGVIADHEYADLEYIQVEAWFSGKHVLRIEAEFLADDDRPMYYVYNYEDDPTSPFGYGLPEIMRDEQDGIDVVHGAAMHNAMVSSGPQMGYTHGLIEPTDNKPEIRGPKTWRKLKPDVKMQDALDAFIIPSTVPQLMAFEERLLQQTDENTNMPMMLQGEAVNAVPTSSGMAMLANQSNIIQRRSAHTFDDQITVPMLTRTVNFLMAMYASPELMIEINVMPRGASYLLVKDLQAQHAAVLLQMTREDQEFRSLMKMPEVYRTYVGFLDAPQDRLFKSDEELQQDQDSPQVQMAMRAQEAEIAAKEAKAARDQAEAAKAMAEAQSMSAGSDDGSYTAEMAKIEVEREANLVRLTIANLSLQEKAIELIARGDIESRRLDDNAAYQAAMIQSKQLDTMIRQSLEQRKIASNEIISGARLAVDQQREQSRQQNLNRGFDSI